MFSCLNLMLVVKYLDDKWQTPLANAICEVSMDGESVHDGYPGEMILLEIIISLSLDVFLAAVVQAVMFYSNYLPLSRMVLVGFLLSWDNY